MHVMKLVLWGQICLCENPPFDLPGPSESKWNECNNTILGAGFGAWNHYKDSTILGLYGDHHFDTYSNQRNISTRV